MVSRLGTLVILIALALGGCSGGEAEEAVHTAHDGSTYTDADAAYATATVQQLAEIVGYVVLADDRILGEQARALADRIRDDRVHEVETLISWLSERDRPIPETVLDHANAGHGGHHGSDVSADLAALDDGEFEAAWRAGMAGLLEAGAAAARHHDEAGHDGELVGFAQDLAADLRDDAADLLATR